MPLFIAAAVLTLLAAPAALQDQPGQATPANAAREAFEQYEGVRVALAGDNLDAARPYARQLVATVEPVGGGDAKKHAEALAAAKTIEDARTHFGELSVILVPKFQEANIAGAHAFTCGMKQRPWMQKGEKIENPYYGKSMLTCGSALPVKR